MRRRLRTGARRRNRPSQSRSAQLISRTSFVRIARAKSRRSVAVSTKAARAAEHGRIGLVHIFGYDSTGMARALESHPRVDRVGSVLSPGLVIIHLLRDQLALLPRPVLAYGLIDDVADAEACLALADAIVVRPVLAARLAAASRRPETQG